MASVDFDKRISKLAGAPVCTQDTLAVWGGEFEAERLGAFLDAWKLEQRGMPWRIWEQVSQIVFEWEARPSSLNLVERGRLFGPGGDLSLRRDGNRFSWHFVGPAGAVLPAEFEAQSYWEGQKNANLYEYEECVLLWGEWRTEPGLWLEDRVGQAQLSYPKMSKEQRVWLVYRRYEEAGQTAFVWYRGLRGKQNQGQEVQHAERKN